MFLCSLVLLRDDFSPSRRWGEEWTGRRLSSFWWNEKVKLVFRVDALVAHDDVEQMFKRHTGLDGMKFLFL